MVQSTYYPGECCPAGGSGGTGGNTGTNPTQSGDLQSTSHEFRDAQSISVATLLAQSGFGNAAIHEVDIDVRETAIGIGFSRGGGADILQPGGTRKWAGAVTIGHQYRPANDFSLAMTAGDVVVISWAEIVA